MHILLEANAISPQAVCGRRYIVGFEVQVEVLAPVNECNRRVRLVDEF
jgi:hypothetical protein